MEKKTRHRIEISTLSPLHIGAGQVLYRDMGFSLDDDHLTYDHRILQKAQMKLPCSKEILRSGCNELRLHLEDGQGRLLLPGSSIKGAMKTLWLASRLKVPGGRMAKARDFLSQYAADCSRHNARFDRWEERRFELRCRQSQQLETEVLGNKDFDMDPFHLLYMGDASYDSHALGLQNIWTFKEGRNGNLDFWGKKPEQWLLETIPQGQTSIMELSQPRFSPWEKEHTWRSRDMEEKTPKRNFPPELDYFFKALREQMKHVLAQELKFWKGDWGTASMEDFVEKMEAIAKELEDCGTEECVLRIGGGSGFHAVTARMPSDHIRNDDDWHQFFRQVRRDKNHDYRDHLPYPKSRKLLGGTQQQPLGFVKLRLLD